MEVGLLFLLFCLICLSQLPQAQAENPNHSFLVYISVKEEYTNQVFQRHCTGSLISPKHVLTSKKCIVHQGDVTGAGEFVRSALTVLTGVRDVSQRTAQFRPVHRVQHRDFDLRQHEGGITIIEMEEPFRLDRNTFPINLPVFGHEPEDFSKQNLLLGGASMEKTQSGKFPFRAFDHEYGYGIVINVFFNKANECYKKASDYVPYLGNALIKKEHDGRFTQVGLITTFEELENPDSNNHDVKTVEETFLDIWFYCPLIAQLTNHEVICPVF
ncbi:hypothetical protein L596_030476 [Steinernema carpocapsae]|uniref:Peptidase S1 domain-containing protein n=2 Tax=Steinernema carpocapsae TaxID=34508 RepID=A0A4U5LPJ4_STECR|nr:hypothetical protein L596_030476 [Steinernema carpocapsae]